ncbi:hypothetical protein MJD09_04830 [bacterium]|nr:hypothetical protein [bacterium]
MRPKKKRFQATDLYWAVTWLLKYLYCNTVPLRWLLFNIRMASSVRTYKSPMRSVVEKNLMALLGDKKTRREIKLSARRHLAYLHQYDPLHILPKLRTFQKPKRWSVDGLQHLESALTEGRGAILASAHFGYAFLIKDILALKGYEVRRVRARAGSRKARKRGKRRRKYSSFKTYLHDHFYLEPDTRYPDDLVADFNIRPLVESLRKGELLLLLGDTFHSANFVRVELLGQMHPFPTGYMSMAMRTGAAILPTFAVEDSRGHKIRIIIEEPLQLSTTGGAFQDLVAQNVTKYAKILETYVQHQPHLYKIWTKDNWFKKRRARSEKMLSERY